MPPLIVWVSGRSLSPHMLSRIRSMHLITNKLYRNSQKSLNFAIDKQRITSHDELGALVILLYFNSKAAAQQYRIGYPARYCIYSFLPNKAQNNFFLYFQILFIDTHGLGNRCICVQYTSQT